MRACVYSATILVALGLAMPVPAQDQGLPIGRTEWTNPEVSGRPPTARAARPLNPRTRIVEREDVTTSTGGAADFFFVNRSRLLVGPQCRVVLDSRFYDPELDTEVKEFSLETLLQCIAKAENILATRPTDRIIISSPRGQIVIAGAVATIALSADDAAKGLPQRGNPVSAPLQVSVSAVRPGGFVSLTGPGAGDNSALVRRSGFVLWIDEFGEVHGPDRETADKAAALRAPLVTASEAAPEASFTVDYDLDDPATLRPLVPRRERMLSPPENCLAESCSGVSVSR